MKKKPDIHQIKHLYYHEKKSAYAISDILGCSVFIIYNCMKRHHLPRRSIAEAHKNRSPCKPKVDLDLTEIVRCYFEERLSLSKIGDRMGVANTTIRTRLLKAGYTLRKPYEVAHLRGRPSKFTEADLSEMERLYSEEELTLQEVAERLDSTAMTVRDKLKKRGIPVRTGKEAQALRKKKRKDGEKSAVKKSAEVSPKRDDNDRTPPAITSGSVGTLETPASQLPNSQTSSKTQQPRSEKLASVRAGCRTEDNGVAHKGTTAEHPDFSAETPTRTYTPPKRFGEESEPIPLIPPEEVTPERIRELRLEHELTIGDIATICSLSIVEVYDILIETGCL